MLLIGIAAFGIAQRRNITAAVIGIRYSQEEIRVMQQEKKEELAEKLGIDLEEFEKKYAGEPASKPENTTDSPQGATPDTPAASVTSPENTELPEKVLPPEESAPPEEGAAPEEAAPPAKEDPNARINELVDSFYALEARFRGSLEGIRQSAISQYVALPKEERTNSAVRSIAGGCISQAATLEAECDGEMNALLAELRTALSESGKDSKIADDIKYYYASEKCLVKAEYMSKFKQFLS